MHHILNSTGLSLDDRAEIVAALKELREEEEVCK